MTEHLPPVISSNQKVADYGSTTSANPAKNQHSQSLPTGPTARPQRSPSFLQLNASAGGHRYSRMSHNKLHSDSQQPLERLEYFLNVLNQMCIGFITIYISYLTLQTGLAGTGLHAWLVTIGVSDPATKVDQQSMGNVCIAVLVFHGGRCNGSLWWKRANEQLQENHKDHNPLDSIDAGRRLWGSRCPDQNDTEGISVEVHPWQIG